MNGPTLPLTIGKITSLDVLRCRASTPDPADSPTFVLVIWPSGPSELAPNPQAITATASAVVKIMAAGRASHDQLGSAMVIAYCPGHSNQIAHRHLGHSIWTATRGMIMTQTWSRKAPNIGPIPSISLTSAQTKIRRKLLRQV